MILFYKARKVARVLNLNEIKQEPIINYPISWDYKLIVKKDVDVSVLVKKVLKQREFKLTQTNSSKNGKYISYLATITVIDKDDRLRLFDEFKKLCDFVI